MTYARCLDCVIDSFEELRIGLCILSTDQHMERDLAAFQGFQMLSCTQSVEDYLRRYFASRLIPFFAVVTIHMPSKVKSIKVAGNS
jgi:hypothetical protein